MARHTGACLGLAVNYAGSQAIPTDSLRSPSFTQRYGISASIMDALPYNFVALTRRQERGVVLMQERPGVYDEYVVDWLYRPVAGAATPRRRSRNSTGGLPSTAATRCTSTPRPRSP